MKSIKSYRMEVFTIDDNEEYKGSIDMDVANDRFRFSHSGPEGDSLIIQINNDVFMSGSDIKPYFNKATSAQAARSLHDERWTYLTAEDIDKAKSKLQDGSPAVEKIDGIDAKHIVVGIKDLQALSLVGSRRITLTNGTVDAWISMSVEPILLKMIVKAIDGDIAIEDRLTWSHFNESLDIQAPSSELIQTPIVP